MGAIASGMALHGGFRVYGATFFVFADYFRPTIRLAAMMNLPVNYVLTHDSFYVGEDGPTHQPVEQIASLRCIPKLTVIRPADPTAYYNLACSYALLSQLDNAFAALDRAVSLGYGDVAHMLKDSDLTSLRKDPRFRVFVSRIVGRSTSNS